MREEEGRAACPHAAAAFRGLESDVSTFVFSGTSERSGEVSETLAAKRAPCPPANMV